MLRKAAVVAHTAHTISCRAVKAISAPYDPPQKVHAACNATQVSGHHGSLQGCGTP